MIPYGDPLAELTHFILIQRPHQLRLSCKDNLDKLFAVCLQIRDQPDLLEDGCFQILRLINGEDDGAALRILVEKKLVEGIPKGYCDWRSRSGYPIPG